MRRRSLATRLSIVNPCQENWEEMTASEAGRFCAQCRENVLDLTHASQRQAERLLRANPAAKCVRFRSDAEGLPVYKTEPRRLPQLKTWALSAGLLAACASHANGDKAGSTVMGDVTVESPPAQTNHPGNAEEVMGKLAVEAPPPQAPAIPKSQARESEESPKNDVIDDKPTSKSHYRMGGIRPKVR